MLKSLCLSFSLILVSSLAHATKRCQVYIPEKEFNHYGYVIRFDFGDFLSKRSMMEVPTEQEADFLILIEGVERAERYFHYADGVIRVQDKSGAVMEVRESLRCLTQLCGIRDYGKAFQKAYLKLDKTYPKCQ
jgi:hypothetical protein